MAAGIAPNPQVALLDQLRFRQIESWKNGEGVAVEILLQAMATLPAF